MGFESFQVTLEGGESGHAAIDATLRSLPHMRLDPDSVLTSGSICYAVDDGRHVIEVELTDSPVSLSCRFTLCHPDTIGPAFLDLIRRLMDSFGMEAVIRDEVCPEHEHPFPLVRFEEFSTAALGYIASRRAEWIAEFGTDRMAASTVECFGRIILPRCLPDPVRI